jgi:hypothetical protein
MNIITFDTAEKTSAARRWLQERDPRAVRIRRHIQVTDSGDTVLIEGHADQVDTVRPNYKTHYGYFRHEFEQRAATWKYLYSVVERYLPSYNRHRYEQPKFEFFIKDTCLAIEFKLCTSDL